MKKQQASPMPIKPIDQQRLSDLPADYDFERPLYRCLICASQSENSSHKYVDECPYFSE